MNSSISSLIHDPDGKIVHIMKDLGYQNPNETVDHAARRLSSEKIRVILQKYYEEAPPIEIEQV